jgi:medium-chain acyl-[acyl-carrier-protein] hydrolase
MTSPAKVECHSEHTICSYDIDPQLTARLPVLCGFMQEAAYHHAEHLDLGHSQLLQKNLGWVLARQRIEVTRLPKWGETVKLRTWPSGRDRLFFYRDFEIKDGDGKRILLASTAWFVIDMAKRERVSSDFYLDIDLPEVGTKVFSEKLGRLKGCGCGNGESVAVNYGDLDMNGHVNNVRYIEWVLNRIPLDFHQAHRIQSLEVNYLAEAVYGHVVSICTTEPEPGRFNHGIFAGDAALFCARSVWKPA